MSFKIAEDKRAKHQERSFFFSSNSCSSDWDETRVIGEDLRNTWLTTFFPLKTMIQAQPHLPHREKNSIWRGWSLH